MSATVLRRQAKPSIGLPLLILMASACVALSLPAEVFAGDMIDKQRTIRQLVIDEIDFQVVEFSAKGKAHRDVLDSYLPCLGNLRNRAIEPTCRTRTMTVAAVKGGEDYVKSVQRAIDEFWRWQVRPDKHQALKALIGSDGPDQTLVGYLHYRMNRMQP